MKRMQKEKYMDFVEDEIEDLCSQEPNHKNCEQLAWMLMIRENLDGGSFGGGRGRMGQSQRRGREWDDEDEDDRYSDRYSGRGGRSFRR